MIAELLLIPMLIHLDGVSYECSRALIGLATLVALRTTTIAPPPPSKHSRSPLSTAGDRAREMAANV